MEDNKIVIYQTEDGQTQIDVRLENDTVWLTQAQIAELFQKDQSVIARHIINAVKEGELDENSNMQFLHNTKYKYRPTRIYDLDTIICVGYRVHSKRGTDFRIWARQIIKDYLIKGYAINQRIHSEQIAELRQLVRMLGRTIQSQPLLSTDETIALFTKNHSFSDGNKRIAATLFLWFLNNNGILYRADGSKRIADNTLVALTLMIAESRTEEKDVMVKVVVNLINQDN